jgi:hypothetical protein
MAMRAYLQDSHWHLQDSHWHVPVELESARFKLAGLRVFYCLRASFLIASLLKFGQRSTLFEQGIII